MGKCVGGVEHVFGELGAEAGEFFLDGLEARFLLVGQLGTGQAEAAQFVVDDALAGRAEGGELGAVADCLIFFKKLKVLPQFGVKTGDLGKHRVVRLPPFGGVHDAVHVGGDAPGTTDAFALVLDGFDEVGPGGRGGVVLQAFDGAVQGVQQAADSGFHVGRQDRVETRQAGQFKQGRGGRSRGHFRWGDRLNGFILPNSAGSVASDGAGTRGGWTGKGLA